MIKPLFKAIKKHSSIISHRIKNTSRKHIITEFAEKNGLVYFGYVNQQTDDHRIVRGLSVSSTHQDNHYCIGSVNGYNVMVVDRTNYVSRPGEKPVLLNVLIMTFDLHTDKPIPHFFIQAKNHDVKPFKPLFNTYPNMKDAELGTFEQYSTEFLTRFSLFVRPAKSAEVEEVVDSELAKVMGAHFWPLSAEQHDNVLYVYSNDEPVTSQLLDTMFENGLWIAEQLDFNSESKSEAEEEE